jgi:hypothetical protein
LGMFTDTGTFWYRYVKSCAFLTILHYALRAYGIRAAERRRLYGRLPYRDRHYTCGITTLLCLTALPVYIPCGSASHPAGRLPLAGGVGSAKVAATHMRWRRARAQDDSYEQ